MFRDDGEFTEIKASTLSALAASYFKKKEGATAYHFLELGLTDNLGTGRCFKGCGFSLLARGSLLCNHNLL